MKRIRTQAGFTIIELLISTVIFSLVLLVITAAITQFGRIYYKGVVSSQTQSVTRNIMSSIAQDIQFGGGSGSAAVVAGNTTLGQLQIGARCYTYKPNTVVSPAQHGFTYIDGTCPGVPTQVNGTEMLGSNMQLIALSIQHVGTSNLYTISVRVAYGKNSEIAGGATGPKTRCNTINLGGQFCYISQLSTTVAKRVN